MTRPAAPSFHAGIGSLSHSAEASSSWLTSKSSDSASAWKPIITDAGNGQGCEERFLKVVDILRHDFGLIVHAHHVRAERQGRRDLSNPRRQRAAEIEPALTQASTMSAAERPR